MLKRKVPQIPARLGRLLVLLPVLMVSPSCAANRVAQFDDTTVVIKGVCRVHFGHAHINWWLLQGNMSNLDIAPEGSTQLSNAKFRVFEDSNGNGTYDAGEKQKDFSSTSSGSGLTINNVSLSAGDLAGWNTENISWQVEVTDSSNHVYVHSQHL